MARNRIDQNQALSWQEWQGSNLRPPVLETGALPIELHSCREPARAPLRAVSSIGHALIARAKRLLPHQQLYPSHRFCAKLRVCHKQQEQTGETMNAQTAARQTSAPQTPSLPDAKPETIGLSSVRLQLMSDAFKREV